MNKIKVIKNEKDYEEALKFAGSLMSLDPDPESEEGEKLALISTLIEDYEARMFPEELPDPIEAIKYRMEQANLKPVDLVRYIGSKSRVSESLSGKRQLTVEMIRALAEGLGIPAKVLIRKPEMEKDKGYQNWSNPIVAEMEARGYFGNDSLKNHKKSELLENLFSTIGPPSQIAGMLRKSSYRSSPLADKHALAAWAAGVFSKASEIRIQKKYKHCSIDLDFMQRMARLSTEENSPILAREHLKKYGIILVVEPHFPRTYLDGAAILVNKGNPVIGLTLRHDRLDNFWFTLMHELAHIALHFNTGITFFYDEIEGSKAFDLDDMEREADALAEESLLPKAKWEISPARIIPSSMAAQSLAHELGVHVAVIAGQIRHKGNNYIYLSKIVNEAKVRKFFPNRKWNK